MATSKDQTTNKRVLEEGGDNDAANKKTKTSSNTIPILRGRFKQKWLTKHSSLIKRSDTASGVMVSCGVHSETRALGQVQNCLEKYVQELFPDCESTWTRFEGDLDVEETDDNKEDTTAVDDKRKEKKFQAVDAACGGLVFYRFRINVKPTEFIDKMMDAMSQLSKPELEELLPRIRHTARWIPLDYICPATTERMAKCFERLREDHFKEVSDDDKRTVAIVTEIRNNISLKKEDIIQTIAPLIPKGLKVDLKKPTDVIFVTVFKSVCGMTVLKDYYEKKKYNIVGLLQEKASAA